MALVFLGNFHLLLVLVGFLRQSCGDNVKDLLQMLLEGAKNSSEYNSLCSDLDISCDKFVVDNCNNICIAGHETVALTASWCLMLLAAYPEWQDRARAKVLEICKNGIPDADMLRRVKIAKYHHFQKFVPKKHCFGTY